MESITISFQKLSFTERIGVLDETLLTSLLFRVKKNATRSLKAISYLKSALKNECKHLHGGVVAKELEEQLVKIREALLVSMLTLIKQDDNDILHLGFELKSKCRLAFQLSKISLVLINSTFQSKSVRIYNSSTPNVDIFKLIKSYRNYRSVKHICKLCALLKYRCEPVTAFLDNVISDRSLKLIKTTKKLMATNHKLIKQIIDLRLKRHT